jgi:hypothetical protein
VQPAKDYVEVEGRRSWAFVVCLDATRSLLYDSGNHTVPAQAFTVACKIGFCTVHFRNSRRTVSLQFLAFVYAASGLASRYPTFWLRPFLGYDPTLKLTVLYL